MFKFSAEVRKVIYITNAIESLNSAYRRLNGQRSVFPTTTALMKALYLTTYEATKKWIMPLRNLGKVYGCPSCTKAGCPNNIRYHKITVKSGVYVASSSNERPTGALDMPEIL